MSAVPRRVRAALASAHAALDALEAAASRPERFDARSPVSKWCVGEQLDHLGQSNALCLGAAALIVAGEDERIVATGTPTLLGRLVLAVGWIPRGKGRAPDMTRPVPQTDEPALRAALDDGRRVLTGLEARAVEVGRSPGRMPHPVLGLFDAAQWVRFTAVHTRHHLKIVRDIVG